MSEIPRTELIRLYEEETHSRAQYRRDGVLYDTNAFKNWLRIRQLNTGLSITQIEKHIAKIITDENKIITFEETDQMHLYRNGVFLKNRVSISKIKQEILKIVNDKFDEYQETLGKRGMIIQTIKDMTPFSMLNFRLKVDIINLKNGIILYQNERLRFITHKRLESRGDILYTFIQFPIYYKKEAKSSIVNKMLLDIFGKDQIIDVVEFVSYILFPTIKYDKAVILQGPPDTGETTFLNLLKKFLGISNITMKEIFTLGKQFQLANLRWKASIIADDLSEKPWDYQTCARVKKIITNDQLSSELKNVQDDIDWWSRCKLVCAGNELPDPADKSDAWWKRWIVILCLNKFKGANRNEELKNKRWSREEMSGLLNKCLQAWFRLSHRRGFRHKWRDPDYVRKQWLSNMYPVAQFVEKYCHLGDIDHSIDYEEFINGFNNHRIENKLKPYSKSLISRRLVQLDNRIRPKPVNKASNKKSSGHKYPYIGWTGLLEAEKNFESLRTFENSKYVEFEKVPIDEEKVKIYDPALKKAV